MWFWRCTLVICGGQCNMIFFELIGILVCVLILEIFFILAGVMLMCNGSPFDAELEDFVVPVLMLVIALTFVFISA